MGGLGPCLLLPLAGRLLALLVLAFEIGASPGPLSNSTARAAGSPRSTSLPRVPPRLLDPPYGAAQFKWQASALLLGSGRIYSPPFGAGDEPARVLVIDPAAGSSSLLPGELGIGGSLYLTAVAVESAQAVVAVPYDSDRVLVIDAASGSWRQQPESYAGDRKWAAAALSSNGKIYAVPYDDAAAVLVVDPAGRRSYTLAESYEGIQKWGTITAAQHKLFAAPLNGPPAVLVIDPATDTSYLLESEQGPVSGYATSTLAPDGRIVCPPYHAARVLMIDPQTERIQLLDESYLGGYKYYSSVLAPNGRIYAPPYSSDATAVLVIDPATDRSHLLEGPPLTGYYEAAVAGSQIFCAPFLSAATRVLVIDTEEERYSLSAEEYYGSHKWGTAVAAAGGFVYAAPSSAGAVLLMGAAGQGADGSDGPGGGGGPLRVGAAAAGAQKHCYCETNPFSARNCSAACCTPGSRDGNTGGACPPLPAPNPWTCMQTVEVPGATEAGAIYPDGSPAKYELNHTGSDGWVVHLSGGGWRFMKPQEGEESEEVPPSLTPDGVVPLLAGSVGSAGAPAGCPGCYGHCDGIMSNEITQNPLFHSWNKIFVPISGTSFTGDRSSDKPYPVRGARILQAVIAHLQHAYGMSSASSIILTGGSSGVSDDGLPALACLPVLIARVGCSPLTCRRYLPGPCHVPGV